MELTTHTIEAFVSDIKNFQFISEVQTLKARLDTIKKTRDGYMNELLLKHPFYYDLEEIDSCDPNDPRHGTRILNHRDLWMSVELDGELMKHDSFDRDVRKMNDKHFGSTNGACPEIKAWQELRRAQKALLVAFAKHIEAADPEMGDDFSWACDWYFGKPAQDKHLPEVTPQLLEMISNPPKETRKSVKVTKKKIEKILQQDDRMKFVSLWYDRSAKQWVFVGGDTAMWSSSGTGIFKLDMLSVEEWADYAYQLAGRER